MAEPNLILNKTQVLDIIRRMAFQIYEDNFQEQLVIFAGIQGSGFTLAQRLQAQFAEIAQIETKLTQVSLDKARPIQGEVELDMEIDQLSEKTVIIVDDVLNTGRTLSYSLKPFLNVRIKKLQIVVLIDRSHRKFPVSADYVGYSLATTLQDHINVVLEEGNFGAYLS